MSKQYNKIEKRQRRRAYLKRKNAKTKSKQASAGSTGTQVAASA
jgi:hypothetical protein